MLAPWPNRLGDGRYSFEGVEAQAPLNELPANNAIHGLVRWMPWRMVGRAQNRVSMACELHPSPGYPFALGLTVEYRLGRDGLTVVDRRRQPRADRPALRPRLPSLSDRGHRRPSTRCASTVPAERRLITDDRGLPTGAGPVAGPSSTSAGAG